MIKKEIELEVKREVEECCDQISALFNYHNTSVTIAQISCLVTLWASLKAVIELEGMTVSQETLDLVEAMSQELSLALVTYRSNQ